MNPIPASSTTTARPRLAHLRVDVAAAVSNWRIAGRARPQAEAAAVVKADAYGLGSHAIAPALAAAGARTFFVATAAEGTALRAILGPGPTVLVLNGPTAEDGGTFEYAALTPVLNSLDQIARWRTRPAAPFALHIDTGMNRLGVALRDVGGARDALNGAAPHLVMSHLACASDPFHPMNERQRRDFVAAAALFPGVRRSLAASAGMILPGGDSGFDLTRPGIALYGSWASANADAPAMHTVARVEAPILQIREVAAGETIGYGATFTAERAMRTATVAAGYADGVPRSLSNRGFAAVDGVICPYVGRVSMDLITIDITRAPGAAVGVMVELLGDAAKLDALADAAGVIPYELLTGFGAAMGKSWA